MEKIPTEVQDVLQNAAKTYSASPATTNAGRWLRFIARVVPVSMIVKLFAHKLN
jgi:hypothetical protein